MNHRTTATKTLRKARELYSDSREVARNGASRAKSFIHRRPILTTLMGMGLGVLIGLWLRPKK